VFDLYGNNRLTTWKEFRDSLEVSNDPLEDVVLFWSRAPFVSPYLNPENTSEWPDPWHLVLDNKYDDLAIALGMLYTIKLTQRFMASVCEIHTSMLSDEKQPRYFLVVDHKHVLNFEYKTVLDIKDLDNIQARLIWSKTDAL
jgi:hypothetical protein